MPRGGKRSHKGQRRHFTSEEEIAAEAEKERRQNEWRKTKGAEGSDPEEEKEESESEEDEDSKPKGVQHLIDVANPNRVKKEVKKVTEIDEKAKPQLSRREREEVEKQQAKAHYQQLHMAGKTEEARADLARLALIRKQREEAAKRREEEKKAKEATKHAAEAKMKKKIEEKRKQGK